MLAARLQDRLDRKLRVELRRGSDGGQHRVAMVGREQRFEHRPVDARARAREGQVDQGRIGDAHAKCANRLGERGRRSDEIGARPQPSAQ